MLLWVAVEEVLGAAVADQHSGKTTRNPKEPKTTPSGEWMGMGHKLEFPMGEFLRPF